MREYRLPNLFFCPPQNDKDVTERGTGLYAEGNHLTLGAGKETTMQNTMREHRMWKAFVTVWGLGLVLVASGHTEETIAYGKRVSLQYTLTLEDQTVIDTSVEEKPLVYTHGNKQIIPGLEKQLTGLQVGDSKKIRVPPEEGY